MGRLVKILHGLYEVEFINIAFSVHFLERFESIPLIFACHTWELKSLITCHNWLLYQKREDWDLVCS